MVTGGASGIGRVICEMLAAEGARLALLDLDDDQAQEVVEEIQWRGGSAGWWHCAVTDEAMVQDVFADVAQRFGGVDLLVNNAAIASTAKLAHEATAGDEP